MEILFALLTIAFIITLGFLARKLAILSKEHTKGISSFVYYFALPALFLSTIARMNLSNFDKNLTIVIGSLLPIAVIVTVLLFFYICKFIKKDTFVLLSLSVVFGSNVFFGVTFFEALFENAGLEFAILTSSFLGPVGVISSILLFEFATTKSKSRGLIIRVFANPLIIAIFLGVIFSLSHIQLDFLFRSLEMLGKSASPLAIFLLGMFIYNNFSIIAIKQSLLFSLFRLTILPITTFWVLLLFNLGTDLRHFLLIQSGIPVAVSLAIYSERFNYKVTEISGMVIVTSVGSFPVLYLLYYLM